MSNWKIDRRRFITGAGTLFTLPLLEALVPKAARANGAADPKRFVSLYMPHGTYNQHGDAVWYPPTGPLDPGNLPPVLSPFAANLPDFSVLKHPACWAAAGGPDPWWGSGHGNALVWLTQTRPTNPGANHSTTPGSSFDQMIAQTVNKPSLVLSCGLKWPGGVDIQPNWNCGNYVSFIADSSGTGQPVEPHTNPVELYNNMFAQLVSAAPPSTPQRAAARNPSILDAAVGDIKELQGRLGHSDRVKLDDYFTSVRHLETQLAGVPMPTSCGSGAHGPDASLDNSDINGNGNGTSYVKRVQAFFDMIALGFKCDLFRSVSFMYDGEVSDRRGIDCPPSLFYNGVDWTPYDMHVGISHYGGPSGGGRDRTIGRDRLYLWLMFYLLDALKQATDPSGSRMLDNSIVLGGFLVADGNHQPGAEGTPMVVGGGRNFMHPGNCFDLAGGDMADLFYTFSTFMGLGWSDYLGHHQVLSI
jgi:hypothetical protein